MEDATKLGTTIVGHAKKLMTEKDIYDNRHSFHFIRFLFLVGREQLNNVD